MEKLRSLTKSRFLKVLLILVIFFVFSYVQPKQKAEAILPLAAIFVPILTSIAVDLAMDLGIDFIDKATAKAKGTNVAKRVWDKYGATIKNLKPTKGNLGKWLLKAPKWLITAIVSEWTAETITTKEKSDEREEEKVPYIAVDDDGTYIGKNSYDLEVTGTTDPFYNTSINVSVSPSYNHTAENESSYAFFLKYGSVQLTPKAYDQKTGVKVCVGSSCTPEQLYDGGKYVRIVPFGYGGFGTDLWLFESDEPIDSNNTNYDTYKTFNDLGGKLYVLFEKYKAMLSESNIVIYEFDGMLVTNGNTSTVSLPEGITPENITELDNLDLPSGYDERDFEFDLITDTDLSIVDDGDEFEWELLEQEIVYRTDNDVFNYNTYNYDYSPTVNNYYVLSDDQQENIRNEIIIIVDNGGSSGGSGDDVGPLDGSLIAYVRNSYDYATGLIEVAVDGIESLNEGSEGLVKIYGNYMGWLPKEVQTLLVSGLGLMIALRIFRK